MVIGIDGNEANEEVKVGVHQMALELLWGIYKLQGTQKVKDTVIVYLKTEPRGDLPKETKHWKYKILPGGRVWILTKLMPELWKKERPDIFFTPTHYLPPILPIPSVCCVTDLGYLKFSGQFRLYDYWQLRVWTAISLYISKYIITISESTAKDIAYNYPFAKSKVKTVYLGSDSSKYSQKIPLRVAKSTLKHYGISGPYILFLSMIKPSKNVEGLIEGYKSSLAEGKMKLVIGGKKGWLYDSIDQKVKEMKLEDDVIFTDYLPDSDRVILLQNAKMLVLPSFWEGFGIDILNAFVCKVPVVVSNVASLPEVAGEAGIYVDPYKPKTISEGIDKILKMSPKEYNKRIELGLRQEKKFSWQKASMETYEVIKKAAKR